MQKKTLEGLSGVGAKMAEKLNESGYHSIESVAIASPSEIASNVGISESIAAKIVREARDLAEIGFFETGDAILKRRSEVKRITTSSESLDRLIGGGIETQSITELYGPYGSGKTQIGHQMAVNVQLPPPKGLNGSAVIIDTESTFRPERIKQLSEAHGMDYNETLGNIHVARAYNSEHQILLVEKVFELAESLKTSKPVRLIVVDSLTSHFRSEYIGRGLLAERQQKLNKHLHSLMRFGSLYNASIIVTNQVHAKPDTFFGDPTKPIGGHVLGHTATFRIYLRRSKGGKRIAKLIDSPHLPEGETELSLTSEGVRDT